VADAERAEAARELVGRFTQLLVREPNALMDRDDRLALPERFGDAIEMRPDRFPDQRARGIAASITRPVHDPVFVNPTNVSADAMM
jgi:hypothetical protein